MLTPYLGVEPVDEVVPRPLPQPVNADEVKVLNNIPVLPERRAFVPDMFVIRITFFQILRQI
jgi:hypothetical protein